MLTENANVLLLDRPTTTGCEYAALVETAIEAFASCAIVVSHDRWFLDRGDAYPGFRGERVRWFEKFSITKLTGGGVGDQADLRTASSIEAEDKSSPQRRRERREALRKLKKRPSSLK
jgi:hypothetical protein